MAQPDEDFVAPDDHLDPDERDIEAPTEDAVEQATPADPAEAPTEVHRGLEVGEWDALEQAHVVGLDDDYRWRLDDDYRWGLDDDYRWGLDDDYRWAFLVNANAA